MMSFHEFLNLPFEALKNTLFFFYTDPTCILCHSDPCYEQEGNGTKSQTPPEQSFGFPCNAVQQLCKRQ